MSATMSDSSRDAPTLDDRVTSFVGDDDHYLRHITDTDSTFSGRHERHVETEVTAEGFVVHNVIEAYDQDAHGESLSWKRTLHSGSCPTCDAGELDYTDRREDGRYVESVECDTCPYTARTASVDAPMGDADYLKPVFYRATVPHNFENEPDVDWDEMREDLEGDADVSDLANIVRSLALRKHIGRVNDAAYDSDEKAIQTVECGHCGDEVETPAVETHAYYGDVCPDCADVTVWSPDEADLPDDVTDRMDTHATFTPTKVVKVLRDALYYDAYKRTNIDDEEKAERVPEGITTGRGGRIDAQGLGRGQKGTGLRRPSGPFHGEQHWRTILKDAKETGLIQRADDADVDDEHKDARWTATDKGREVFDALARCETCGGEKRPYKRTRTYQTKGRYTKKDSHLTLVCADCDQMQSRSKGMTVASSTGQFGHSKLDGVDYDDE